MIKNLLPEDSRLAEIASAISILIVGILIASGNLSTFYHTALFSLQREEFWSTIFIIFGSVQFISLLYYIKLDMLRCMTSLICGCFLIWVSLGTFVNDIRLTDVPTFILGITNLYAFIINSAQIGRRWGN